MCEINSLCNPTLLVLMLVIFGAVIGSFLNTVIYRFPLMKGIEKKTLPFKRFNLLVPRSHCRKCHSFIPLYHNIPIISFCLLRGKCLSCKKKINFQYPFIEILSSLLCLWLFLIMGNFSLFAFFYFFSCCLLVLAFIDLKYQTLPNEITYPLIGLGLAMNLWTEFIPILDSVSGCLSGYLFILAIEKLYFFIRNKHGIGRGDAKLLAGIGSWLGWHPLAFILLLSCLLSLCGYFMLKVITKKRFKDFFNQAVPFGPSLACSSILFITYFK